MRMMRSAPQYLVEHIKNDMIQNLGFTDNCSTETLAKHIGIIYLNPLEEGDLDTVIRREVKSWKKMK